MALEGNAAVGVDKSKQWYREVGTDKINQETLQPATESLREHELFKRQIFGFLKGSHANERVRSTKESLQQQLEELDSSQLRDLASSGLVKADKVHSTYVNERKTGMKRAGRVTQNFFKVFSDFLAAYSGIVDLVKGAGQQYGEAAYEALSLFLIVVVNKSNNDKKISKFLVEMGNSFPNLETLMDVYPSTRLETSVASVYKHVIKFARDTAVYFTRFSVRVMSAIGKPPSMGIDVTVATIQSNLAEVNSEAMVLLHVRSQQIHQGVQKLKDDNEELLNKLDRLKSDNQVLLKDIQGLQKENHLFREKVEEKSRQEDTERLEAFKLVLGVTYPSPETDLERCRHKLFKTFPDERTSHRKVASRFEQMTRELLEQQKNYFDWENSEHSCLLWLSGTTATEGRLMHSATYSWLSPATVYIAENIQCEKNILAFYCCHPELRTQRHPIADVMSNIIFQIVRQKSEILRDRFQHFQSMVQKWKMLSSNATEGIVGEDFEKAIIQSTVQLLREALTAVNKQDTRKLYIILDRVDQCDCKTTYLMNELAKLVRDDSCKVKIAVVNDTAYGMDWVTEKLDKGTLEHVMSRVEWRQRRMAAYERASKISSLS